MEYLSQYPPNTECSLTHLAPCFELYYVKEVNLSLKDVFYLLVLLRIRWKIINSIYERNEMGIFFSLLFLRFWYFILSFSIMFFFLFWIIRSGEKSFRERLANIHTTFTPQDNERSYVTSWFSQISLTVSKSSYCLLFSLRSASYKFIVNGF